MFGEQYGAILSTALAAGLLVLYPLLFEYLIFGAIIIWISIIKLLNWADKKRVGGYLKSIGASICAIFGIAYVLKDNPAWIIMGYVYLIFAIYSMKIIFEDTVNEAN